MRTMMMLFAFALVSCGTFVFGQQVTASEQHAEHEGHGHGDGPAAVITHYTKETELFVEFAPLTVGDESEFAAHFTRLTDFSPVAEGEVIVSLSGGGSSEETFRADPSETPGIFTPVAKPRHAGDRKLTLALRTSWGEVVHDLGTHRVYPSIKVAEAEFVEQEESPGLVAFLKETQWKVDFATAVAKKGELEKSVPAVVLIKSAPQGEAHISASADGIVQGPPHRPLPALGEKVEKGELMATIAPRLVGQRDMASLRADVSRAEARLEFARATRNRVEELSKRGIVKQQLVDETLRDERLAEADLAEARKRITSAGAANPEPSDGDVGGVPIRAPITAVVTTAEAAPGQFIRAGATLFHISQPGLIRVEAHIAEAHVIRLRLSKENRLWITPPGWSQTLVLSAENARLLGAGVEVDHVRRTIPIIFEINDPTLGLSPGMSFPGRVGTGEVIDSVVVPTGAVIDDQGVSVVFVVAGGERFERRIVKTGQRDRSFQHILEGLTSGERVVSRGAYLVKLAASDPSETGHGHAH